MAQCNENARCGKRCEKQENPMGCSHSCLEDTCRVCYPDPYNAQWAAPKEEAIRRPSWDSIWMDFAQNLAKRSTCSRSSVGCVIVSEDHSAVLGLGYNGGPKGLNNECISSEPGKCGHLHAEINALIKTNYRDASAKKAYITLTPCYNCAVALINANIKEVIYRTEYRDPAGLNLLVKAGILVRKYIPEGLQTRDLYLGEDRKA